MPVSETHPLYDEFKSEWLRNQDAIDGERKIKRRGSAYLPVPDPENAPEASEEYQAYKTRAVYTNFTGRTVSGLTGLVFREDPLIELPPELEYMRDNADGNGLTLISMAYQAVRQAQAKGRFIVVTSVGGEQEIEELEPDTVPSKESSSNVQAKIVSYFAENAINWDDNGNALKMLNLKEIVLDRGSDGFGSEEVTKNLVYRVTEDGVTVQHYKEDTGGKTFDIRYADGSMADLIPADIIGSVDNNPYPDQPPISDIASLNVAHYRNSASNEEGIHITSQPTAHINTGDTSAADFKELNGSGIKLGSKVCIITQKGDMKLIQAAPNSSASEAMIRKEEQMIMLGAQIIQPRSGVETAEAAKIRASAETSILTTITANVSQAFENRLKDAALFMGANPDDVKFKLSDNFYPEDADPQVLMAMIQASDRGSWTRMDIREYGRRTGMVIPERTDEIIDSEIASMSPLS